jgi:hypothetical protein
MRGNEHALLLNALQVNGRKVIQQDELREQGE